MAVPAKRVLGCSPPWLGFLTCGMFGVIAVPQAKVVQAVQGLSPLVEGKPKRTRQGSSKNTKYAATSRNNARKKYRGQGR